MSETRLDRRVDVEQLAAEIAAAHGWASPAVLSVRQPGETDEDGNYLPGSLVVHHDDADEDTCQNVLDAHTPAPSPDEAARKRLRELYAKGWGNLSTSERDEVAPLVLTVLGS